MDEIYIDSSIIDQSPSLWRDVRNVLKHKKEEITTSDLAHIIRKIIFSIKF